MLELTGACHTRDGDFALKVRNKHWLFRWSYENQTWIKEGVLWINDFSREHAEPKLSAELDKIADFFK